MYHKRPSYDYATKSLDLEHLKTVSRIKHLILEKYLPAWEGILGSKQRHLYYIDCYAGPGLYESQGQLVSGSPIIAINAARAYLKKRKNHTITIVLIERDKKQLAKLSNVLNKEQHYLHGLEVRLVSNNATDFLPGFLSEVDTRTPSFYMVDPYGHPLTIPILNQVLTRPRTEVLITFMYYRINMDAGNPKAWKRLDTMFGTEEWRKHPFMQASGWQREQQLLDYFLSRINARFKFPFRIRFDPEDKVSSNRTKYYLIHTSNHDKAVLLMKEVMWPLGDEVGVFEFSGQLQGHLFPTSQDETNLQDILLQKYAHQEVEFDQIRRDTWSLPFIEKHYRSALKELKKAGRVKIIPVTSKTEHGLRGKDRIHFS